MSSLQCFCPLFPLPSCNLHKGKEIQAIMYLPLNIPANIFLTSSDSKNCPNSTITIVILGPFLEYIRREWDDQNEDNQEEKEEKDENGDSEYGTKEIILFSREPGHWVSLAKANQISQNRIKYSNKRR